jgi:serine/threonine-protein kinase
MTDQGTERYADDKHRYRLESRIATGGMGEVWRATDTTLGRPVAIKLLKHEYADDPQFRARFEIEARHAASLHHPGVASVYDVGEAAGEDGIPRPFLVMELVDGQPLSALIRGGRPLDPAAVRDLLAQAADAIGAAHRAGIVHRDLKPANLLVTRDRKVKITDFGIARATEGVGLTGTGQVMGTPQYLSPEQARGNPATPASDVYSLGVVGFECLTGHRPFEAESPVATALAHLNDPVPPLPASVPADLAAVIQRALSKDPAQRYADGDTFATALRDPGAVPPAADLPTEVVAPVPMAERTQVLTGVPAAPAPVPPTPTRPTPSHDDNGRSPWPLVVLLVALLAVAVVIVFLILDHNGNGNDTADTGASDTTSAPTESASTQSSSPTSTAPTPFSIDENDYIGRNVDQVADDLRAKGLHVTVDVRDNPGGEEADTVVNVSPTTGLHEGDTVTVTYWGEAPPSTPPTSATSTPSTSSSPSASSTPPTPSASTPSSSASAADSTSSSAPASGATG